MYKFFYALGAFYSRFSKSKKEEIFATDTQWLVNYTQHSRTENRILQGESEKVVRERFLSVNYNARINSVIKIG